MTYHSYFHDGFYFTGRIPEILIIVMTTFLCAVAFLNKWEKSQKIFSFMYLYISKLENYVPFQRRLICCPLV